MSVMPGWIGAISTLLIVVGFIGTIYYGRNIKQNNENIYYSSMFATYIILGFILIGLYYGGGMCA